MPTNSFMLMKRIHLKKESNCHWLDNGRLTDKHLQHIIHSIQLTINVSTMDIKFFKLHLCHYFSHSSCHFLQ